MQPTGDGICCGGWIGEMTCCGREKAGLGHFVKKITNSVLQSLTALTASITLPTTRPDALKTVDAKPLFEAELRLVFPLGEIALNDF